MTSMRPCLIAPFPESSVGVENSSTVEPEDMLVLLGKVYQEDKGIDILAAKLAAMSATSDYISVRSPVEYRYTGGRSTRDFYGPWSIKLMRRIQDKFNFTLEQICQLQTILSASAMPLEVRLDAQDITRDVIEELEPELVQELVGHTLLETNIMTRKSFLVTSQNHQKDCLRSLGRKPSPPSFEVKPYNGPIKDKLASPWNGPSTKVTSRPWNGPATEVLPIEPLLPKADTSHISDPESASISKSPEAVEKPSTLPAALPKLSEHSDHQSVKKAPPVESKSSTSSTPDTKKGAPFDAKQKVEMAAKLAKILKAIEGRANAMKFMKDLKTDDIGDRDDRTSSPDSSTSSSSSRSSGSSSPLPSDPSSRRESPSESEPIEDIQDLDQMLNRIEQIKEKVTRLKQSGDNPDKLSDPGVVTSLPTSVLPGILPAPPVPPTFARPEPVLSGGVDVSVYGTVAHGLDSDYPTKPQIKSICPYNGPAPAVLKDDKGETAVPQSSRGIKSSRPPLALTPPPDPPIEVEHVESNIVVSEHCDIWHFNDNTGALDTKYGRFYDIEAGNQSSAPKVPSGRKTLLVVNDVPPYTGRHSPEASLYPNRQNNTRIPGENALEKLPEKLGLLNSAEVRPRVGLLGAAPPQMEVLSKYPDQSNVVPSSPLVSPPGISAPTSLREGMTSSLQEFNFISPETTHDFRQLSGHDIAEPTVKKSRLGLLKTPELPPMILSPETERKTWDIPLHPSLQKPTLKSDEITETKLDFSRKITGGNRSLLGSKWTYETSPSHLLGMDMKTPSKLPDASKKGTMETYSLAYSHEKSKSKVDKVETTKPLFTKNANEGNLLPLDSKWGNKPSNTSLLNMDTKTPMKFAGLSNNPTAKKQSPQSFPGKSISKGDKWEKAKPVFTKTATGRNLQPLGSKCGDQSSNTSLLGMDIKMPMKSAELSNSPTGKKDPPQFSHGKSKSKSDKGEKMKPVSTKKATGGNLQPLGSKWGDQSSNTSILGMDTDPPQSSHGESISKGNKGEKSIPLSTKKATGGNLQPLGSKWVDQSSNTSLLGMDTKMPMKSSWLSNSPTAKKYPPQSSHGKCKSRDNEVEKSKPVLAKKAAGGNRPPLFSQQGDRKSSLLGMDAKTPFPSSSKKMVENTDSVTSGENWKEHARLSESWEYGEPHAQPKGHTWLLSSAPKKHLLDGVEIEETPTSGRLQTARTELKANVSSVTMKPSELSQEVKRYTERNAVQEKQKTSCVSPNSVSSVCSHSNRLSGKEATTNTNPTNTVMSESMSPAKVSQQKYTSSLIHGPTDKSGLQTSFQHNKRNDLPKRKSNLEMMKDSSPSPSLSVFPSTLPLFQKRPVQSSPVVSDLEDLNVCPARRSKLPILFQSPVDHQMTSQPLKMPLFPSIPTKHQVRSFRPQPPNAPSFSDIFEQAVADVSAKLASGVTDL